MTGGEVEVGPNATLHICKFTASDRYTNTCMMCCIASYDGPASDVRTKQFAVCEKCQFLCGDDYGADELF